MNLSVIFLCALSFLAVGSSMAEDTSELPADSGSFESLFNGEDLTGWRGIDGNPPTGVAVIDGALQATEKPQFVYTVEEFDDFELRFSFKLPPGGDSGIGLRAPPNGDRGFRQWNVPAYTAIEVQILDNDAPQFRRNAGSLRHGGVCGLLAPPKRAPLNPTGEWNTQRIRLVDSQVEVWVNEQRILKGDVANNQAHAVSRGRYPGAPGGGAARARGSICFMNLNPGIAFRDIEILRIPQKTRRPKTADNVPPEGFSALFNGVDLDGWQGALGKPYDNPRGERKNLTPEARADLQTYANSRLNNWAVRDGVLTCLRDGRDLITAETYGNFELHLEYRLSPDCDAGLLLRDTPLIQLWDAGSAELKRYGAAKGSGALWFHPLENYRYPIKVADKPAGEWNHLFIRVIRDRVSVWLNDELVLNGGRMLDHWDSRHTVIPSGGIGISASKQQAEYKNVYVRQLK